MNNPIWIMSSAYKELSFDEVFDKAERLGAQGVDLCVFRNDGTRTDHVATHLNYHNFNLANAQQIIDKLNQKGLALSIGAFENLIGGEPVQRRKNQDHLLQLIRIAHLLGGNQNGVKVGTFVGYNHELGNQDGGFQKNLDEYQRIFTPIVRYAEDLGVTILYENCPMEGWRPVTYTSTFNNLTGVLAARKLLYTLIPSKAHGEIYDPSHDVWQNTDPVKVIEASDMHRIHRIHVKATRNQQNSARTHWGSMYPAQMVDEELAKRAGIPLPASEWDRHNYEAMMPGFGGSDSMDWRAFVNALHAKGFEGAFEMENEAVNSKGTGNPGAIDQGFRATILFLAPMLWPLNKVGYQHDSAEQKPLEHVCKKDIPVVTMNQLMD